MSVESTRRSLGLALLGYLVAQVAVVTLMPFQFRWPTGLRIDGFLSAGDVVQNVALFVPLGFIAAFGGVRRPVALGVGLSLAVEVLQEFLPGRYPSLFDVSANTLGAFLGGVVFVRAERLLRGSHRAAGILALDLPLMGLVYLTLPLLWLSGLAVTSDPARRWLVALPALMVAVVLASVGRHHLRARGIPLAKTALLGGAGMVVALLPGWLDDPEFIVVGAGVVVVSVIFLGDLLGRSEPDGRRYEVAAVRRAMAPFGCYLVLTAVWPLSGLGSSWHSVIGASGGADALGRGSIIRLLEMMAGCTVAGYAMAESRARSERDPSLDRASVLLAAAAVGGGLAGARGFHDLHRASLIEAALFAVAAAAGAVFYWRQRAYLFSLLGVVDRPGPTGPPGYRIAPPVLGEGAPKWR